jgi:hypothetical protein
MTALDLFICVVGTLDVIGIIFIFWLKSNSGKRWMDTL